jgi:hypothetical protein
LINATGWIGNGTQVSFSPRACPPDDEQPGALARQENNTFRAGGWALAIFCASLAPALAAVWAVPWFVPQDAPAHVYNAQVLAWSFRSDSPFRDVYTVRWRPIPNWAGPLTMAGLVAIFPAWLADRIMTSLTLAAFAAAVFWLRWRLAGVRGLGAAALLASLLAMNMMWLFGFASFALGACLFPITLGWWWSVRDQLSPRRIAVLAALLAIGYFCHLVSLGLTVLGLIVLAVMAPVPDGVETRWRARFARLVSTSAAFIPLLALGLCYVWIAQSRGKMEPIWRELSHPFLPKAWVARLEWADPLSLAIRDGVPLTDRYGPEYIIFAPVVWLGVAVILWWYGRITAKSTVRADRDRSGWFALAVVMIIGGVAGPDSLGAAHGEFLPQRVVLLGLAALVPIFDVDLSRWSGRATVAALAVAVTLQSAIVWDYALYSDATAGQIIRAREAVGRGRRIATLLVSTRSRFRPNPLLHAEDWLGVDTGNVVWNNYETLHYYFPVRFRAEIDRPHPGDLEWVSIHEGPSEAGERRRAWEQILSEHAPSIDVVVHWKSDPALEAITTRWFDHVERQGDVRIFRKRRDAGGD